MSKMNLNLNSFNKTVTISGSFRIFTLFSLTEKTAFVKNLWTVVSWLVTFRKYRGRLNICNFELLIKNNTTTRNVQKLA